MIVKRKLYSVIDEEGNLGYYLYNEATGEEKLFSVVEEERLYASMIAGKLGSAYKPVLNDSYKQFWKSAATSLKTKPSSTTLGRVKAAGGINISDTKRAARAARGSFGIPTKKVLPHPSNFSGPIANANKAEKIMRTPFQGQGQGPLSSFKNMSF
jgi:hypothetical protein